MKLSSQYHRSLPRRVRVPRGLSRQSPGTAVTSNLILSKTFRPTPQAAFHLNQTPSKPELPNPSVILRGPKAIMSKILWQCQNLWRLHNSNNHFPK